MTMNGVHILRYTYRILLITFFIISQKSGYFTNKLSFKDKKAAFERVPRRLHFCLKQIVPYCYLTG